MNTRLDDLGRLILRIGIAGLLLVHGISKLQNGIGFVHEQVSRAGLPAFFAYGVYLGEIVAPALVLIGLFTRPAAMVMAFDVFTAVALARRGEITTVSQGGGLAIELELALILGSLAIACLGAGRFAFGTPSAVN